MAPTAAAPISTLRAGSGSIYPLVGASIFSADRFGRARWVDGLLELLIAYVPLLDLAVKCHAGELEVRA